MLFHFASKCFPKRWQSGLLNSIKENHRPWHSVKFRRARRSAGANIHYCFSYGVRWCKNRQIYCLETYRGSDVVLCLVMLLKIVDLLDGNARFLGTIFTKMSMFDDGTQFHWAEKQITSSTNSFFSNFSKYNLNMNSCSNIFNINSCNLFVCKFILL